MDVGNGADVPDLRTAERDAGPAADAVSSVDVSGPDVGLRDQGHDATPDVASDASATDVATADLPSLDMLSCPDMYEPNDTVNEATVIAAGTTIAAINCGFDDDDVYAIDLVAGQMITLTHSFSNAAGNLDMNLHAPSQAADVSKNGSAVAITFAFEDVETIQHVAEETGTYYVLSFNNNESQNPYTLRFDVQ